MAVTSACKICLQSIGFLLLSGLLVADQALAEEHRLYTNAEKNLYLQPHHVGRTQIAGIIFAATEVTLLEQTRDALHIRLTGWREQGANRAIYEQMGQRILAASLRVGAQERTILGDPVVDPETDLIWHPISLDVWVSPDRLTPDPNLLWDQGVTMFQTACANCHSSMRPNDYLSNQWIGLMKSMERYITLDKPDYRFLQKYLQLHASDMDPPLSMENAHAD